MFIVRSNATGKLLQTLNSIRESSNHYFLLHFKLSELPNIQLMKSEYIIACNLIDNAFDSYEGGIFTLENLDMAILFKGSKIILRSIVTQVNSIFLDSKEQSIEYYDCYDLNNELDVSYEKMTSLLPKAIGYQEAGLASLLSPKVLTTELIKVMREAMRERNLGSVLRGQNIYDFSDLELKTVYREYYMSIAHLTYVLNYDMDLKNDMNMFMKFTEELDQAMIRTILSQIQPEEVIRGFNMNLSSLQADNFTDFIREVVDRSKSDNSGVVIEINLGNYESNKNLYTTVYKKLREAHNTKSIFCLDGVSFKEVYKIKLYESQFDYIKIQWPEASKDRLVEEHIQYMRELVDGVGANKIILCNCDSEDSINFGQKVHIKYFQGWFPDKRFYNLSKK